jgi:hypothetical protein
MIVPLVDAARTGDTINNLALGAFLVNARSVAHVVATLANSTAVIDAEKAGGSGKVDVALGVFGVADQMLVLGLL